MWHVDTADQPYHTVDCASMVKSTNDCIRLFILLITELLYLFSNEVVKYLEKGSFFTYLFLELNVS